MHTQKITLGQRQSRHCPTKLLNRKEASTSRVETLVGMLRLGVNQDTTRRVKDFHAQAGSQHVRHVLIRIDHVVFARTTKNGLCYTALVLFLGMRLSDPIEISTTDNSMV
jgi:hypothetical protein